MSRTAAPSLAERLDALGAAAELAQDRLPDPVVADAAAAVRAAGERQSLSAEHTVVGFFGATGSGKSSLLDALSAVLVPAKHLRFNAAAQDAGTNDRSRTVLSYVRGAYRRVTQETTGEVVTDYLRPGATRSGIALTFTRLHPADTLTLL